MKQTETPKTRPQQLGPSRPDPSRRRPAEATAALVTGIRRPGSPARGGQFTPLTLTRSVSSFSDVGGWRLELLAPRSFGLNPCFEHVCSLSPSGRCTETDRRRPRSPSMSVPSVPTDWPARRVPCAPVTPGATATVSPVGPTAPWEERDAVCVPCSRPRGGTWQTGGALGDRGWQTGGALGDSRGAGASPFPEASSPYPTWTSFNFSLYKYIDHVL